MFSDNEENIIKEVYRINRLKDNKYVVQLEKYWIEEFNVIDKSEILNIYKVLSHSDSCISHESVILNSNNGKNKSRKLLFILMKYCNHTLETFVDKMVFIKFGTSLRFSLSLSLRQMVQWVELSLDCIHCLKQFL